MKKSTCIENYLPFRALTITSTMIAPGAFFTFLVLPSPG